MFNRIGITALGVAAAGAIGATAVAATHNGAHAAAAGASASAGTVRTQTATVAGKAEKILTDAHGLPLYYYTADTATSSMVTGGLAAAWPPVTSSTTPTATGLSGRLSVVRDSHGDQLAYNGHLLYTFVSDHRAVVTGQGVEGFLVATPQLSAGAHSSAPGNTTGTSTYGGY